MKQKDSETIFEMALPFLIKEGKLPENPTENEKNWARELVALYQPQMSYAAEIVKLSEQFFNDEIELDEAGQEVVKDEQVPELMNALYGTFEALEDFSPEAIKKAIKDVQKETGIKGKNLFMPIRVVITGETKGPELPNAIHLIGKDKVLERIKAFI